MRGVAQATTRAMATELSAPSPPAPVRAVLVSFGGSPRPDLIALALGSLAEPGFDGRVLVMPAPDALPDTRGLDVELIPSGSVFHERLAAVDMAILGGGLSLYEAAFLGVPSVAVPVDSVVPGYERHQLEAAGRLAEAGCCLNVGLASGVSSAQVAGAVATLLASAGIRGKLGAAGMRLLDGHGLMRTTAAILDLL